MRWFWIGSFLLLLVLPLMLPFGSLFQVQIDSLTSEAPRFLELAKNTLFLIVLTLALSVPFGLLLAILFFRCELPGRGILRLLLLSGLFIPLPVLVSAWQMAFGPTGWLMELNSPTGGVWKPWTEGLLPAAMIHALAALPWVTWFLGLALQRTDLELEEDALTHTAHWQVVMRVSFRQIRPALGMILLWITLQTASEITVTDVMLVRTFAEEVYNQFVLDRDGLPVVVLLALPQTILLGSVTLLAFRSWRKSILIQNASLIPRRDLRFSPIQRHVMTGLALLLMLIYLGIPLFSLLWRAGGNFLSLPQIGKSLQLVFDSQKGVIWESLFWSMFAGILTTLLAFQACRIALISSRGRSALLLLTILIWATPAPLLGFGLKEAINLLLDLEEMLLGWQSILPLRFSLYDQPSPLPVLWCHVLKCFPFAVAILFPAMLQIPQELREQARIDGASGWREFRLLHWPQLRGFFLLSTFVVMLLALSEISASKLVEVPGRVTFAQELFRQMHYGTGSTVAAFCLLQFVFTGLSGILIFAVFRANRSRN